MWPLLVWAGSNRIKPEWRGDNRNGNRVKRPDFMALALKEAEAAALRGEVPVGAVIASGDTVVATAGNRTRELADPTAHAEMLAIREACQKLSSERLTGH